MTFVTLAKEKSAPRRSVSDKSAPGYDYESEVLCITYCSSDAFNKRKREQTNLLGLHQRS